MSRYAPYPPEWDDEPTDAEWDRAAWSASCRIHPSPTTPRDADDEPCPCIVPLETPDGLPADDVHHAVAADIRDAFLHPDREF